MKQLEVFVPSNKLSVVIDAIVKEGVGCLTVIQAKGRGKVHRPLI